MQWTNKTGQWYKSQNRQYNGQMKRDNDINNRTDNTMAKFGHCIVCAVIYIIVLFCLAIVLSVLLFISLSCFVCPLYCLFCDLYHCPVSFGHCIVCSVIYSMSHFVWPLYCLFCDLHHCHVSFGHCIVCSVIYIIVLFRLTIVLSVLWFISLSCFVCPL
jgi:hypothetical protein